MTLLVLLLISPVTVPLLYIGGIGYFLFRLACRSSRREASFRFKTSAGLRKSAKLDKVHTEHSLLDLTLN